MSLLPAGGWLVACSAADAPALWMYERLRARGRVPIGVLFVEALAPAAVRWEHRVGTHGASLSLTLADGGMLHSAGVAALLNRVTSPPLALAEAAESQDRDYARQELTAFAASWLYTLAANVVNKPHPHGLCGRWRQPLEWRALAARAGMTCAPLRLTTEGPDMPDPQAWSGDDPALAMVLAIDGRVLHDGAPAALHCACARLCRIAETRVLGLRFEGPDPARAGWRFVEATPFPDLTLAGESGVAALERALAT